MSSQHDPNPTGHVMSATDLIGSGQEGNLMDQVRAGIQRMRGGELGALPAIAGFIVLTILFTIVTPIVTGNQSFLTIGNFANLISQAAPLIMLGMALVFVILLGEIDLSAGVTAGAAMCLFIVLVVRYQVPWMLALSLAFVLGVAIGALIGFFVARVGIPSFVVTLGLFLGLQGVELVLIGASGSLNIQVPEIRAIQNSYLPEWAGWALLAIVIVISTATSFWDRARRTRAGVPNRTIALVWIKLGLIVVLGGLSVFALNLNRGRPNTVLNGVEISGNEIIGVPIVVPFVLAILWLGTFVLDRTRYGRHLYAIGGNQEAARRAGVKVVLIRWTAFIVCSGLAVVSGLFTASRVGSVDAAMGREIVLSGVAAAVIGGVSLFGGRGRIMNAAIGALVIAVITNGLGLLRLPAGVNFVITGGVLILAATVDALSRRRSGGGAAKA